ncbi:unnamed protein product [Cyclocybe aegerita]|uniref:Uncharacterized protein n=1 Tax=Cyclocybe aegerita TaxID=1973307 RepID=A0A8S0X1F6_CYCAE|nr:unnamed protein product [Cyclocybe aegerita]
MATSLTERLHAPSRTLQTKKTRPYSTCKRTVIKRTDTERAVAKARKQEERLQLKDALKATKKLLMQEAIRMRERFGGHSVSYYYEKIMQTSRINRGCRAVSLWNAFLAVEMKARKDEADEDDRLVKVSEISHAASVKWSKMSSSERKKAAAPGIELVEEAPAQDAHKTLNKIEHKMRTLRARTGVESFLVAVRTRPDQYGKPFATVSSKRGEDFFNLSVRETMPEFALRFEAFCLSGVQGVASNYVQQTIQMKHELAALILSKLASSQHFILGETAGIHVPRMYYTNFDDNITAKYAVILVGWPLDKFCNPSEMGSCTEVALVHASFNSGAMRFEKLSAEAFTAWEEARFNAAVSTTTHNDSPLAQVETPSPAMEVDANATAFSS